MKIERVDNLGFHGDNKYYLFSDFGINSFEELLALGHTEIPKSPNWHGLEQSLRYSDMFAKAFMQATEKGFNLFTTTLVNGKLGHASEGALQFAFSVLGVEWTEAEKSAINQILESHNFVTRI
jgi:hypothetical protein